MPGMSCRIATTGARVLGTRRGHAPPRVTFLVGWLAAGMLAVAAAAEPYRPADDDEVVETLPQVLAHAGPELASMRRELADDPQNVDLAVRLAGHYLQIGKRESDPRFFGYARAALRPWWGRPDPPAEVLRLRAKLQERDHLYKDAIADQRKLLERDPEDVQALIEVANLYWVQGEYDEARAACGRLEAFAGPIPVLLCRTQIQATTGEAEEAYAALDVMRPTVERDNPAVLQYIYTSQAVIAEALGWDDKAERHFREGLVNDPGDQYLIRAYADYLLDRQRYREVISLTLEHLVDTGLLLRAAIAAKRGGEPKLAAQWAAQLQSRFDEVRLRDGQPHGRYEARFMLEVMGRPAEALRIAMANWEQQKQARDSRNALEAAVAAGDAAAVAPVVGFLRKHHTQDVQLERLIAELAAP